MSRPRRTLVFISCGQCTGSDEIRIASAIASELDKLGYDSYVAKEEQSLRSIKENIFRILADSEYYLFVDFKRELLKAGNRPEYRGSLFTHQELAIASYLDKEVIAFQEYGVKKTDGLIWHLQANAISFDNRESLPKLVRDAVLQRQWSSNWLNQLELLLNEPPFDDNEFVNQQHLPSRFFHLRVANRHNRRVADNCYAFLDSAVRRSDAHEEKFGTVEFKWAGTILPAIHIGPSSHRVLDAFWVAHANPCVPQFNCFADSSRYVPKIIGPGEWILNFRVVSSSFPTTSQSFLMTLDSELSKTSLDRIT